MFAIAFTILQAIDRMAGRWLDWRMSQSIKENPELRKFEVKKDGFEYEAFSPMVAILADQAAKMLNANNAKNYLQFDMLPRLDRGLRPIRVTVQWANGMSPAQKNAMLEERTAFLYGQWEAAISILREWPFGDPWREKAMKVYSDWCDFVDNPPDWFKTLEKKP